MRNRVFYGLLVLGCLVAGLGSVAAQAQVCEPLDNGRLANVFHEGTVLGFEPVVEFREMVLTITGPCEDIVRVFGPKDQISFDIREIERVTDGQYSWELRRVANIDPGVQEDLQAARGTGEEDALWWSYFQKGDIPEGPYVDSGAFSVERGLIVDPTGVEEKRTSIASKAGAVTAGLAPAAGPTAAGGGGDNPLSTKDFVINDDLIVIGSTCIGFDCVNGEAFGFDTLRFKENNTRIQFNDTSGSSFPTNNWQIRANSSQSGGESFLGFMDQGATGESENGTRVFAVEAGAGSNALFVESGGDVGVGTGNPVLNIHVVDGDSPGLRLEQDGSSGFQPQIWDIAGNETNFFVRDVTSGSTLPFRIFPGSSSSSLVIRNSRVGVGTSSPTDEMTVKSAGSANDVMVVQASGTNTHNIFRVRENSNNSGLFSVFDNTGVENIRFTGDAGGRVAIGCANPAADLDIADAAAGAACNTAATRSFVNAGSTNFTASSSRTIKKNIESLQLGDILTKIKSVPAFSYDFIDGPQDRIGLMAEDFHTIFGRGSDKLLDGQEVDVALWLGVQALVDRNEELEVLNQDLAERLARVEELLAAQE